MKFSTPDSLIFLDVDGVLHPLSTGSDFCCAPLFNTAIHGYNTQIILASDWRIGYPLDEIQTLFNKCGIHIFDTTPDLRTLKPKPKYIREAEIELWRALNAPSSPFVVVDDNPKLFSASYRKKNVVLTNKDIGFSENNQQAIITKLNASTTLTSRNRLKT